MTQMRTVLRPGFKSMDERHRRITPTLSDYILVPKLALAGTWEMREIIPPTQLAALARFANELEARGKR